MESVSTESYQPELPCKPSSVSVYWKKITIPKGLPLLLETFVRETIRENPNDIYKFLTGLSESLLAKRSEEEKAESANSTVDEPGTVSAGPKVKQVDEESPLLDSQAPRPTSYKTAEPEGEQPEEVVVIPAASSPSPSSRQQEDAPPPTTAPATAAEVGDSEPSNVADLLPLEVAAVTTLQAGYRGYKTRKDLKEKRQRQKELADQAESSSSPPPKNENDVKESSSLTDLQIDSSTAEENAAASKLQAGFRGFQTRKALKEQNKTGKLASAVDDGPAADDENVISESSETTVEQPTAEEVAAATKLQAGFRGFQTRKALKGETDLTPPSSRPGSPAVSSQLESHHEEGELRKSPTAPTIPENEELAEPTASSKDPVSESPFSTSSTAEEANDEEIAAEIKTPLETIREESFDRSLSACNIVAPLPPGVIAEMGRSETPPTPLETDLGHKVEDLLLLTSKSHFVPQEDKNVNVHVVSTEEISAALGDLLDDTEDEKEESSDGSDPSLRDTDVTKDPPKVDAVDDSSNNDRDNKNDELKSSSAEDAKDGSDLAPIQDQPDPTDDGPETKGNNDDVSPINELLVDTPNPQESEETSPIVDHNDQGDPAEVADVSKENILQMGNEEGVESTKEVEISESEQPQEAINLSPSENVGDARDQICGDDDKDDKNKRSESSKPDGGDDDGKGDGNAEIEREMNVEENTPNINNVPSSPAPQEEVGQQAHEDVKILDGDTDQINHWGDDVDAEEKSESIQLPHSNVSALTDSSADREDTDIATPTDFSNHEERESLNLEELKKFASNFEAEMEPTSKVEEGAAGTDVASTVPSESQLAPAEVSSSSPEGTSSSPAGEVMQIEVKESESKAAENLSSETEDVKPTAEATSPEVSEVANKEKESEQPEQSEISQVTPELKEENAGDKTPSEISQPAESPDVGPTEPITDANTSPATTKQLPESSEGDPTEIKTGSDTAEPKPSEVSEPLQESTNEEKNPDAALESPESPKSSQSTTTEQLPAEAKPSEEPTLDGAKPPPETVPVESKEVAQPDTTNQSPVPEDTETESKDTPEKAVEDAQQAPGQEPVPESATNEQAMAQDSERSPASPPKDETSPEPAKTDEASTSQEPPQAEPETSPQPSETPKPLDNPESPQRESTLAPSSDPISNSTNEPEPNAAPVISNEPVDSLGGPDKQATPTTTTGSDNIDEIATKPRPQRERGNKEGDPTKSIKPTVRPRLSGANKQSRSVAVEDSAIVGEREAASESASSPVLRRPKSGPGRSRVATSKYRSGRVIDNQMSMDEMEKEIENEMMNNAAVKIQAGFRGFKTRKTMRSSEFGVSKKARKPEQSQEESNPTGTASLHTDAPASCELSASSTDTASAQRLSPEQVSEGGNDTISGESIAARGAGAASKPPLLSTLRSHSFPGSHELEDVQEIVELDQGDDDPLLIIPGEQEIELDLDPDYINKAAVRIQKNFRGYQVRKSLKRCPSGKENNGSKGHTKSMKMTGSDKKGSDDKSKCESQNIMERLHELNNQDENAEEPAQPEKAAVKIQASFRSYKERTKYQKKKKAAITLQANIRGFLTRKRLANLRRRSFQRRRSSNKAFQKELEDLRKVNDAATKIQAVFRGYQVRSKILPRSGSMISEHEQMVDE